MLISRWLHRVLARVLVGMMILASINIPSGAFALAPNVVTRSQAAPVAHPAVPAPLVPTLPITGNNHTPHREKIAPRQPFVRGAIIDIPMRKRPLSPHLAPPDPFAMSAAYRAQHGITTIVAPIGNPPSAPHSYLQGGQGYNSHRQSIINPQQHRETQSLSLNPSYTGINRWWTYEEDGIPGVGKYYANVNLQGNLLVQSDDMNVPHKGIALAFRRTYNSLSTHDYAGTDNSQISNYGAGWTNTFDAHIAGWASGSSSGLSVYDIDGARYDYTSDGQGGYTNPPGQFATLTWDGATGYYWTKESGTVYYFYSPTMGIYPHFGLNGRLKAIYGRNSNAYLSFSYAWSPDDTCSCHLTNVYVYEDGNSTPSATLTFQDVTINGSSQRLLSTLQWPDQQTTFQYFYSSTTGSIAEVDGPVNSSNPSSQNCTSGSPCLPETYSYASPYLISTVSGPNFTRSQGGEQLSFSFSSGAVSSVAYYGYMNPAPIDGITNSLIQPNQASGATTYRAVTLSQNPNNSTTQWSDTDGHQSTYTLDSTGRVKKIAISTGGSPATLSKTFTWNSQNELTATTDFRQNTTDYAYDANDNLIAEALPAVTNYDGSTHTFRPTSIYEYDGNNNLADYCDPETVHQAAKDWASFTPPPQSFCASAAGAAVMTWTPPPGGIEPDGELVSVARPVPGGTPYVTTFTYSSNPQGGADYGLPTSVTGAPIVQNDLTTRTPSQQFSYDSHGNLVCYKKLNDPNNANDGWWSFSYDSGNLGRLLTVSDPDDASILSCNKTHYQTGSNIVTTKSYFANGQIASSQTSPEYAAGNVASLFTYDGDGNETTQTKHFNNAVGVTQKFYDGASRLVEIVEPSQSSDYYSYPFAMRYFYDLTKGGSVSINQTGGFAAHGNPFDVQRYLGSWTDTKGNAYDAMDRVTSTWQYISTLPKATTSTYDQNSAYGFLTQVTLPNNDQSSYSYDNAGRTTAVTYQGPDSTPNKSFSYDADGRVTQKTSSAFGTWGYSYDVAGNLSATSEGSSSTFADPSTLTYAYYGDGKKASISVSTAGGGYLNQTSSPLYSYSYRSDGRASTIGINLLQAAVTGQFSMAYSPGGRETSAVDPFATVSKTYNSAGLVASNTIPAGTLSGYSYDAEAEITGETCSQTTYSWAYSVRGEQYSQNLGGGLQQCVGALATTNYQTSANGVMLGAPVPPPTPLPTPTPVPTYLIDGQNGIMASSTQIWTDQVGVQHTATTTTTLDSAGRRANNTNNSTRQVPTGNNGNGPAYCTGGGAPNGTFGTQNSGEAYDAENHLTQTNDAINTYPKNVLIWNQENGSFTCATPSPATNTYNYGWGPNDHPVTITESVAFQQQNSYTFRLHWDGDTLLWVDGGLNNTGYVDIKLGALAEITPAGGMTVFDRDIQSGALLSYHYANGNAGFTSGIFANPSSCSGFPGANSQGVAYAYITMPRADGICDGRNLVQGARVVDPASGTWLTPDAFSGSVHDPESQLRYVYNRGNAENYSDPTGFAPQMAQLAGSLYGLSVSVSSAGGFEDEENLVAAAFFGEPDLAQRNQIAQNQSDAAQSAIRMAYARGIKPGDPNFMDEVNSHLGGFQRSGNGLLFQKYGINGQIYLSTKVAKDGTTALTVQVRFTGRYRARLQRALVLGVATPPPAVGELLVRKAHRREPSAGRCSRMKEAGRE